MNSIRGFLLPYGRQSVRVAIRVALAAAITVGVPGCHDDDYDYHSYDVPNSVAVIDMNGDGVSDIVFAATRIDGTYPNPGFAGVILQNTAAPGTFQTSLDTAAGFAYTPDVPVVSDGSAGPVPARPRKTKSVRR